MKSNQEKKESSTTRCRGVSLVELLVVTALVAISIPPLFFIGQSSTRASIKNEQITFAEALTREIYEEVKRLPARDPDGENFFGMEETGKNGERFAMDDLDDYNLLIESPPRSINGSPYKLYPGFQREVEVSYVNPKNFNRNIRPGTSDFIRVRVKIKKEGKTISTLQWIRVIPPPQSAIEENE